MLSLANSPLPADALLQRYRHRPDGTMAYTDCFTVGLASTVTLAEFVFAFYTTPLFRLERVILRWLAKLPSTDEEARQLAGGSNDAFAAWTVEDRADDQLLMCDLHERTRSWFMVAPKAEDGRAATTLYFGSAVVPVENRRTGKTEISKTFSLLLWFHRVYSVLLLRAARKRLE